MDLSLPLILFYNHLFFFRQIISDLDVPLLGGRPQVPLNLWTTSFTYTRVTVNNKTFFFEVYRIWVWDNRNI